MSAEKLGSLRDATGMSQKAFAKAMGLPLRTYENLEAGRSTVRPVHLYAARWAIVRLLADSETDVGSIEIPDEVMTAVARAATHIKILRKT